MVTNLLDCEVVCIEEGTGRYGDKGCIRGLYLESTDLMVIVEWDDSSLSAIQLFKVKVA